MVKKQLYIILGTVCIILGSIGIVVPLLPTTPFLLLAIFLYMRSSKKAYLWVMRNRILSPYIYSYFSKQGIPRKVLIRTLSILWGTVLISIIIFAESIYIKLLLLLMATLVTIHIVKKRKK